MNEVWEASAPAQSRVYGDDQGSLFLHDSGAWNVAFLLLVSLVISAVLSTMGQAPDAQPAFFAINCRRFARRDHRSFRAHLQISSRCRRRWKYVWIGAVVTAVLFHIGKWGLGIYLAKGTTASAFGAMGSLVALSDLGLLLLADLFLWRLS
jgi:hypothetical protein